MLSYRKTNYKRLQMQVNVYKTNIYFKTLKFVTIAINEAKLSHWPVFILMFCIDFFIIYKIDFNFDKDE